MVGGLIAANSSTILTHLNWGASYLVHDFYRRFVNKDATEKHYVMVGRLATVGLFLCAARHGLPPGLGQGLLRHHPPGRRRDGPALPGPLVLVAGQRLVRSQRHDQLVRRLHRPARPASRAGVVITTHYALLITIAVDHDRLGADGLPRAADGQGEADLVL